MGQEIMKQLTTIEEHIQKQEKKFTHATGDLSQILYDINLAAKFIRSEVIRFGLGDQEGKSGTENSSGELVQKLDIYANDVLKQILGKHGRFSVLASEEEENVVTCGGEDSKYVILFDPLDGSSNIEVNVSVGTIFSIYKVQKNKDGSLGDCLQKGTEQVAAGYIIYGSSVVMVYTAGQGVHGFTYDPTLGEFFLSHEDIKIPDTYKCFSMNDLLWPKVKPNVREFIEWSRTQKGVSGRYVGSLVADFHRNLLKGGIYIYPATDDSATGKLRLLYEANPLAFICEQAGGAASDGDRRILEIEPKELHQRVPLYIGNADLVNRAKRS